MKQSKKKVKVRDMKPKKDAKGGIGGGKAVQGSFVTGGGKAVTGGGKAVAGSGHAVN
ncbi:MAG TPA: hypothetical protein VNW72_07165 [Chthoniobacterales bacterium]|jgi:hypothetical protein|nr:hypothetical protein [Chthoniobacterales bacterium]